VWFVLGCEKKRKKGLGRVRGLYSGVRAVVRKDEVKVRDWHMAGGDDDATLVGNDEDPEFVRNERQYLWRCHRVATRSYESVTRPRFYTKGCVTCRSRCIQHHQSA
jgi:hypothetical protein